MTEEILEKIKKEYQQKTTEQKNLKKQYNRLLELENNETVKEYLSLKEKFGKINTDKFLEISDDDIIRAAYSKYLPEITETNKIYVYLGAYSDNIEKDILHGSADYRVNINDHLASYVLYKDLENDEIIKVSKKDYEQFKSTNNIIIPNRYLTEQYHYELQQKFFKDCIKNGQQKALTRRLDIKR